MTFSKGIVFYDTEQSDKQMILEFLKNNFPKNMNTLAIGSDSCILKYADYGIQFIINENEKINY